MKRNQRQNRVVRSAAVLLFFCLLLPLGLCGCNFGGPSDEEVQTLLSENLEMLRTLTDLLYGEGIPLEEGVEIDPTWTTQHYFKVHPDYRYQTIAQVKADLERLFTDDYLEVIYDYAFNGTDDYTARFGEDGGVLTMDVVKEPMGMLSEVYPETAKVVSGSRYSCKVEVECLTSTGSRITRTISLSYVETVSSLKDDTAKDDAASEEFSTEVENTEVSYCWKFDSAVF